MICLSPRHNSTRTAFLAASILACLTATAQQPAASPAAPPQTHYLPGPAFDTSSIDPRADPCNDFY